MRGEILGEIESFLVSWFFSFFLFKGIDLIFWRFLQQEERGGLKGRTHLIIL